MKSKNNSELLRVECGTKILKFLNRILIGLIRLNFLIEQTTIKSIGPNISLLALKKTRVYDPVFHLVLLSLEHTSDNFESLAKQKTI